MGREIWCGCQLYGKFGKKSKLYSCSVDDPDAVLVCGAHLAEGRAFECHKRPIDVKYNPKREKYDYGLYLPGDMDFKPAKGKVDFLLELAKPKHPSARDMVGRMKPTLRFKCLETKVVPKPRKNQSPRQ